MNDLPTLDALMRSLKESHTLSDTMKEHLISRLNGQKDKVFKPE
jgi:hypothetical protein